MKKLLSLSLLLVGLLTFVTGEHPEWRVLGPGGGGGQFFPTINPNDPTNVMVRCDMSGTFITRDDAESWEMVNFGKTPLDYEIDPQSENILYVAAQGLFRSLDKGNSWEIVYPLDDDIASIQHFGDHADPEIFLNSGNPVSEVVSVRVDPDDSQHVWIGLMDGSVLYTHDSCRSWQRCGEKMTEPVRALFPGRWWRKPAMVLAAGEKSLVLLEEVDLPGVERELPDEPIIKISGGSTDGKVILYAISATSVFTSTDLGVSWTESKSDVFNDGIQFSMIETCVGSPLTAYLSSRSEPIGILKTEDGGSSWKWIYKVADNRFSIENYDGAWLDESYGPEWRGTVLGLGVNPLNPDVCYASDFGSTYRTLDGGETWKQVYSRRNTDGSYTSRGLDVTTCYGVHFDPFDEDHMFVSYTDIGAFQSYDGGEGWEHSIKGVPVQWRNTCYWMVFDPEVEGRAWSVWGNKHDLPRHKMFRHGRLLERARGGVAVSSDSARTWTGLVDNGIPEDAVCTHILLDERSPVSSRTLYLTAFQRGIYKSTNSGANWERLPDIPGSNRNYWRLAQSPKGDLYVLVARDRKGDRWAGDEFPGGLYRSSDGGESWKPVDLPRGNDFPHDLVFDPMNADRIYLSMWAGSFEGGEPFTNPLGGGLLKSDDNGNSWKQVFDPTSFVYSASADPRKPGYLYLVTFEGAGFYSEDHGESWNLLGGYDFKWGHRPVLDPRNPDMLYITTFGGGLWHGPVKGAAESPVKNVDPLWRWHRVMGER